MDSFNILQTINGTTQLHKLDPILQLRVKEKTKKKYEIRMRQKQVQ